MFILETESSIASDSLDHIKPSGASTDLFSYSKNRWTSWYDNLLRVCREKTGKQDISILDLGCAGGSNIEWLLETGITAVGLEGTPHAKKTTAWKNLEDTNLFLADITKPFQIKKDNIDCKFDCITSMEVLEHIECSKLPIVLKNMSNHLEKKGILFFTIGMDMSDKRHVCIQDYTKWLDVFGAAGFCVMTDIVENPYFGWDKSLGSPKQHRKADHESCLGGFESLLFCLQRK